MPDPGALKEHLLQQFRHTRHANGQIIDALDALENAPPERALQLLSHALRAQDVWLARIRGEEDLPAIWQMDTLAECRARNEASSNAWLSFLRSAGDLTRPVEYENSKGTRFKNELREICAHVVNHATHHRAQIATLIREAGGAPPATDFVFWARTAAAGA